MTGFDFIYPARIEPEADGCFLVTFRDLPEALTDGATLAEARVNATDALAEALAGRIRSRGEIPSPSAARRGDHLIAPERTVSLKAALHEAARRRGLTIGDLARRLDLDRKDARCLLDPRERSKASQLERALKYLGLVVGVCMQPAQTTVARSRVRVRQTARTAGHSNGTS